jgi:hypothetical protein
MGGHASLVGPLLLVQDPGQQQSLIPVPGEPVQKLSLVHGLPSFFRSVHGKYFAILYQF